MCVFCCSSDFCIFVFILSVSSSQLFTEYGRLAMDEIFLKPFQVSKGNYKIWCGVAEFGHWSNVYLLCLMKNVCHFLSPPTVFDVPNQGLEFSL